MPFPLSPVPKPLPSPKPVEAFAFVRRLSISAGSVAERSACCETASALVAAGVADDASKDGAGETSHCDPREEGASATGAVRGAAC